MNIYPAIDILGGKAVRLRQGDYESKQIYDTDPLRLASQFEQEGAPMIHVVDLDGAKDESLANDALIRKLANRLNVPIQVGGGIRSIERAQTLLNNNVSRIIVGSMPFKDPEAFSDLLKHYGPKVALAIDAHHGMVKTGGWLETTEVDAYTFARQMVQKGVSTIIYTDIAKDGMLSGIDSAMYEKLLRLDVQVVASGGVKDLDDIKRLGQLPLEGVIVGKAIYEKKFTVREAITCLQNVSSPV